MRNNELKDLMFKLCDFGDERFEIVKAVRAGEGTGVWYLSIHVDEPTNMDVYEIVRALNGWNKDDFWSVRRIEDVGEGLYQLVAKRVLVNDEANTEAE